MSGNRGMALWTSFSPCSQRLRRGSGAGGCRGSVAGRNRAAGTEAAFPPQSSKLRYTILHAPESAVQPGSPVSYVKPTASFALSSSGSELRLL